MAWLGGNSSTVAIGQYAACAIGAFDAWPSPRTRALVGTDRPAPDAPCKVNLGQANWVLADLAPPRDDLRGPL